MTKITPPKLQAAFDALMSLTNKDKEGTFVFKSSTRIRLGTNLRKVRDLLREIMVEQDELVRRHGSENPEKPGEWSVAAKSDKRPDFDRDLAELMKAELDIDIQTISNDDLFNKRMVKSRDDKGQVSENEAENQIGFDTIADLQAAGLLSTE